jgi:hypothetical protein
VCFGDHRVLPRRDLGIWHVSTVIPSLIMMPLGGVMLDAVRDRYGVAYGYGSIFALAALFMLVGTGLVKHIRGVK